MLISHIFNFNLAGTVHHNNWVIQKLATRQAIMKMRKNGRMVESRLQINRLFDDESNIDQFYTSLK